MTKTACPPSPVDSPTAQLRTRLDELKGQLHDLCQRLPAHSASPSMIAQMEDLEDEIARLQQLLAGQPHSAD